MIARILALSFAMTFALQVGQTVPVGFFGDPVVAFILRTVSIVLSLALSGTIIVACIKMIAYFGAAGEAQKNLTVAVGKAESKLNEFALEIRAMMLQHDRMLTEHHTTLEDHERRLGERRQNPGRREANHHDL